MRRGVRAVSTTAATAEGDVLIGADGLRSTVRQHCLPDVAPVYAGYVAWRALLAESALPPAIHRALFEAMTFCLPPGEQFLGYPVAGPDNDLRAGHRRYNVVWYRPADEANELPAAPHRRARRHPRHRHSAAARSARRDRRDARCGGAAAGAAIARRRALDRGADPAADLRSGKPAPRLRPRRAHRRRRLRRAPPCRRRRRQGGRRRLRRSPQALDADDDVAAALTRFEAARLPENRKIIERARHLGAYLQATQSDEERTRSARHGIPQAVLAETAVLDFLYAKVVSGPRRLLARRRPSARMRSRVKLVRVFEAGGKAQQVAGARRALAFDRGAVLDQAFDAAERCRALPQFRPRPATAMAARLALVDADRQHAAEAALSSAARRRRGRHAARGRDKARPTTAGCPTSRVASVAAVCACRRTRRSSVRMPRINSQASKPDERAAELRAHLANARPQRVAARRGERAGDDVGMAVEIFGRRMHDDVGAERATAG